MRHLWLTPFSLLGNFHFDVSDDLLNNNDDLDPQRMPLFIV